MHPQAEIASTPGQDSDILRELYFTLDLTLPRQYMGSPALEPARVEHARQWYLTRFPAFWLEAAGLGPTAELLCAPHITPENLRACLAHIRFDTEAKAREITARFSNAATWRPAETAQENGKRVAAIGMAERMTEAAAIRASRGPLTRTSLLTYPSAVTLTPEWVKWICARNDAANIVWSCAWMVLGAAALKYIDAFGVEDLKLGHELIRVSAVARAPIIDSALELARTMLQIS